MSYGFVNDSLIQSSNLVQYMSSIDDSKCYIVNFNLRLDTINSKYLAFLHPSITS